MSKLASTAWGAQASTLRTSALALCYSVAEHCCPVWSRSSHVSLVDSQLNHAVRLISGCVQPTQTPVAPILLLRLYVVGQPQTNCSVTSRPIQTGLCMRMCLTPTKRLVARRPTTPVDQERSGKKTGCRLLWSIVILYATLLTNSLASTCHAIPGHC